MNDKVDEVTKQLQECIEYYDQAQTQQMQDIATAVNERLESIVGSVEKLANNDVQESLVNRVEAIE